MKARLTVEESARKVIDALGGAGYTEDEVHTIFRGLYHGKAWTEYDLYRAIHLKIYSTEF